MGLDTSPGRSAEGYWFDSHCHLDPSECLDAALFAMENSVRAMVVVGTDATSCESVIEVAQRISHSMPGVVALSSVGVHPHEAADSQKGDLALLEGVIASRPEGLVGLGECGLDYYYEFSPREIQIKSFFAQIELAKRYDLTLVIHTRDAWDDAFAVLDEAGWPERVVFHCFVGGIDEARRVLDHGSYISISGIVTFKNSAELKEVAAFVPTERLLIETDSPYLTPVPNRGKPNTPGYVSLVGAEVAKLRNCDISHLQGVIWTNTLRAFNAEYAANTPS